MRKTLLILTLINVLLIYGCASSKPDNDLNSAASVQTSKLDDENDLTLTVDDITFDDIDKLSEKQISTILRNAFDDHRSKLPKDYELGYKQKTDFMYSYGGFDLIIPQRDLKKLMNQDSGFFYTNLGDNSGVVTLSSLWELDGLKVSYAAEQLVKLINTKESYSGGRWILEAEQNNNLRFDNSFVYSFIVRNPQLGILDNYKITQWGKVFKGNDYYGRISKAGNDKSSGVPELTIKTVKYADVVLHLVEPYQPIDGFSVEKAVAYLMHVAAEDFRKVSHCADWMVMMDGVRMIDGVPAYDFVMTAEDGEVFRMAVARNGKSYIYDLKPELIAEFKDYPLPESNGINPGVFAINKGEMDKNPDAKKRPRDYVMSDQVEYPNYRLQSAYAPDEKQAFVRKAAENIYQQIILKYSEFDSNVVANIHHENVDYKIVDHLELPPFGYAHDWLIKYRNSDLQIGDQKASTFDIGKIDVNTLRYTFLMKVVVSDNGKIYRLKNDIHEYGQIPSDVPPLQKVISENDSLVDYDSDKGSCDLWFKAIDFDKNSDDRIRSGFVADYVLSNIQKFYHGSVNANAWHVMEKASGELNGEKIHEFLIGQGQNNQFLPYLKIAASDSGKIYVYHQDKPEFVETIPSELVQRDKKLSRIKTIGFNNLKNKFMNGGASTDGSNTEMKSEAGSENLSEHRNTGTGKDDTVDFPVNSQTVDDVRTAFRAGFVWPEFKSTVYHKTELEDFNYYAPESENTKFNGIDGLSVAAYINTHLMKSLDHPSGRVLGIRYDGVESIGNESYMFISAGYLDGQDKFRGFRRFLIDKNRKLYEPKRVYQLVQTMEVQAEPKPKDDVEFSPDVPVPFGPPVTMMSYPLFTLGVPLTMPDFEGYPVAQAAAEIEASYLHTHNDGNWKMKYHSIDDINGEKSWVFDVLYSKDKNNRGVYLKVAATSSHKLYREQSELSEVMVLPAKLPAPKKFKGKVLSQQSLISLRNCLLSNDKQIAQGMYVSKELAAHWAVRELVKKYTGSYNNNPWRVNIVGIKSLNDVEGYEFEIGQGKYQFEKPLIKALVTQDRKIYQLVKGKYEFVSSIPDNAPELAVELN